MQLLAALNRQVGKLESWLVSILLISMVFLAFLQVVMRNVFHSGITWADVVVRLLVLWVGFLGASLAGHLGQHLTVEVLTKFLSGKIRYLTSVVVKLFAMGVCLLLLKASLRFLSDERMSGELFFNLFPSWWTLTILPITFTLIPFHFFCGLVEDAQHWMKGDKI